VALHAAEEWGSCSIMAVTDPRCTDLLLLPPVIGPMGDRRRIAGFMSHKSLRNYKVDVSEIGL